MKPIRQTVEDACAYLAEHPEVTAEPDLAATAVREDGLRFRVEGPKGIVITDMPETIGGRGEAVTPGWLLRAALASCDATMVAIEAARAGVELTHLTVTVDSDSDSRGFLAVDEAVPAGPLAVRVRIELAASNASEDRLREIAQRAESRSPVRDALVRALAVTTEIVTS